MQGPGQICLDYNTFVCMTCSGVHREFQHKCKGISMSKWTPEEVRAIENGGNEKDQAVWLGSWDPARFPKPAPGDLEKIRKFIQMKYVERRWYVSPEKAAAAAAGTSSAPPFPANPPPQVVPSRIRFCERGTPSVALTTF